MYQGLNKINNFVDWIEKFAQNFFNFIKYLQQQKLYSDSWLIDFAKQKIIMKLFRHKIFD